MGQGKGMQFKPVYIVSAARTPVGSFRSALKSFSATKLGSIAIKGCLQKSGIDPKEIDEVFMGNVLSANLGQAPTKQAAEAAGLPESTICTTINKVCASGMKSITLAAQTIALGQQGMIVAGGMESMSNVPFYLDARGGFVYGNQTIADGILRDGLWDPKYQIHMGNCAEETAEKYGITREQQDAHAIESYKRAAKATSEGKFQAEIISIAHEIKNKEVVVSEDEEFKNIKYEKVPTLRSAFIKNGTVTAANSSTLNDGASSVILSSKDKMDSLNIKPIAKILAFADAECNPKLFTIAPSLAIPKALKAAGLGIDDISLFEINEAFSVVVRANEKILGLDPSKVNVNGGGVSLGHPIGSSGSRIVVSLIHALKSGQKGCAAICNGGGGATSIVIEKL